MESKARSILHQALACTLLLALAALVRWTPSAAGSSAELQVYDDPVFQQQALVVARRALQGWVRGPRDVVADRLVADLAPCEALLRQRGIFVSLETWKGHRVRGCRGTLVPRTSRLVDELVGNVREAACRDPLHSAVRPDELDALRIVLCVPGAAGPVREDARWDPHTSGLLVRSGDRAAVMLPWEAPDCVHQMAWGRKRAGIRPDEPVEMICFAAVRFAEAPPAMPAPTLSPRPGVRPWW
jgi:AMMECR1 domain-containing protein